jgi:acyl-coenzyme A synthetase/AMP-(fatty) acid ligase
VNVLTSTFGVKKDDTVSIYLPMTWHAAAFLTCARIGAIHSVIFAGLCAALSVKYVFDVHPGDRFACMVDVGWITGHTCVVYSSSFSYISCVPLRPSFPSSAQKSPYVFSLLRSLFLSLKLIKLILVS